MQLAETSPPSRITTMLPRVVSLLLCFAVRDGVEDILEHIDTVQVSKKTGELVFIKNIVVKRYLFNFLLYNIYLMLEFNKFII